jgi:hypothetical protein
MKSLYRKNLDYLNTRYLSFKDKNISKYLKKLQESIEKEIFTAKKLKDYVHDFYYYPDRNYEKANQPVDRNVLGEKIALVLSGGGAREPHTVRAFLQMRCLRYSQKKKKRF